MELKRILQSYLFKKKKKRIRGLMKYVVFSFIVNILKGEHFAILIFRLALILEVTLTGEQSVWLQVHCFLIHIRCTIP